MAILGHAASAEDGSGFGRPGDQTGHEVRMETLGPDGNNWQYIFNELVLMAIINQRQRLERR